LADGVGLIRSNPMRIPCARATVNIVILDDIVAAAKAGR
jgi:hypothetical protein